MNELTSDDYNLILKALDSWKSRGMLGELMSVVLGSVLVSKEERQSEEYQRKEAERIKKMTEATDRQKAIDDEIVTLLKAKLIKMRDSNAIKEIIK